MSTLRTCKEPFADRISSEPVEDTDTTTFVAEISLEANYPVQVTDPNDAVTLHLSSMPSGYLSPSNRIKQPVKDTEECVCPTSTSPDDPKELQLHLNSPCEKCCRPAPPPKISDILNDKDLLDLLRLKLDPNHCTVKNWKNFASRWGMSYDELTLLEHRTQGSLSHSPTQEFLLRYNQKPVTELTELCRFYQRIDVLLLLQRWMEKDWPSRWKQAN
ncbi:ectodysplasin-A receptor-associated adapter protein isoform X3 [Festucalex cinctus]